MNTPTLNLLDRLLLKTMNHVSDLESDTLLNQPRQQMIIFKCINYKSPVPSRNQQEQAEVMVRVRLNSQYEGSLHFIGHSFRAIKIKRGRMQNYKLSSRFKFQNIKLIAVTLFLASHPAISTEIVLNSEAAVNAIYPVADEFLGEKIRATEVQDTLALINTLEEKIGSVYKPGNMRRDAHPKAHGCVAARLDVNKDIPVDLAHGVFQSGASYEAKVRFSNGSPNAKGKDIKGDSRGMAIKLYGIKGEKLFSSPGQDDVQDFILISSPYFFINDAHNYTKFFEAVDSGNLWQLAKIPFYLGFKGSRNAYHILQQKIANPLETRYWSVVPSQLGLGDSRRAVKYSVKPCDEGVSTIPKKPTPNYLREAMKETLSQHAMCMTFMIQPRPNPSFLVEDIITEWAEPKAPFYPVATLTIPKQSFDTPEQNSDCENESYNPWHSLADHKPLGEISRIRRAVYQALSDFRHKMNNLK